MEHVFIIAGRSDLIESLTRFFRFSRGSAAKVYIRPPSGNGQQYVQQAFSRIAEWIESTASQNGQSSLRKALIIVELSDTDLGSLVELNPIAGDSRAWASVVAMLVLAFPEPHWVFLSPHEPFESSFFTESHVLGLRNNLKHILQLHDMGFTPMFDPTGLRSSIQTRLRTNGGELEDLEHVLVRDRVSASIDEEEAYACFNAYATFRFGFRSHSITSYAMMNRIFGRHSNLSDISQPTLVFEDLYLRFPDKSDDLPLSDLNQRDEHFPKLAEVKYRIFVTVGHRRAGYAGRWKQSQSHLDDLRPRMWVKVLYKPFSGMFDLWHRSGLERKLAAEGFKWTTAKRASETTQGGHSAPGRLLTIAEHLIGRSNTILQSADSVPDAVHGALLALSAQELLGNRTPTTMLEALALKHQLEVLAECMFYGVEHNMDVESRFDEIKRDVASVRQWFHPRRGRLSALNAQIRIVNELSMRFREHNQFDEEQQCLTKLRELHRHLWFRKHAWWGWLIYPARWYVDFLLSSVLRFVLAILFWIVVFSFLFALFPHLDQPIALSAPMHGLMDAVTAFFGLQPVHDLNELKGEGFVLVNISAILAGFIHLGILISHLYSIIARR